MGIEPKAELKIKEQELEEAVAKIAELEAKLEGHDPEAAAVSSQDMVNMAQALKTLAEIPHINYAVQTATDEMAGRIKNIMKVSG